MKNFLFIFLILTFFGCSSNNNKAPVTDSANAIEQHPLQDTTVDTLPNGYAAPNDSVDSGNHHRDSTLH